MDEQQDEQVVLTAEERVACAQVAAGASPHSLRAQAILALADGATVAEAVAKTGLTEHQVKIWRGRFRNGRLTIFPAGVLIAAETALDTTIPDTIESLPALALPADAPAKKEKKGKDGNKKKDKKKKGKKKKDKKNKKKKSKKSKKK